MIRAIGYIRQSDEREDKEDISEQTQLEKIKAYCDLNNWTLVEVFKDIDVSGFRISYTKRTGLMNAIQYAKKHKIEKLVVYNLSRLTRRRKDFLMIQESLESLGVDICSTAEMLDFGSPTGRLVANILVNFNEYYSDNLSDVTMANKKTNAEKGRWNGGPAPFGLVKHDGVFVADGENADIVKRIFQLALEGNGPYKIAKYLNEQEVKTETGVDWSPRRVRYVLTNETYAGVQKWQGEYYELKGFEKLISWDEFLYIQDTLFGKEKAWKGKNRQLLTSVLRCPICGSKMFSRLSNGTDHRRYLCALKNDPRGCESPVFDQATLDDQILKIISQKSKKRYWPETVQHELDENENDVSQKIRELRTEYERLDRAKQKVFDDYYLHQKINDEQFQTLMFRYEQRQEEINKLLERTPIPMSTRYGGYEDILSELGQAIYYLPSEDKRRVIELLIDTIIPDKETKVIFKWGEEITFPVKNIKRRRSLIYYY